MWDRRKWLRMGVRQRIAGVEACLRVVDVQRVGVLQRGVIVRSPPQTPDDLVAVSVGSSVVSCVILCVRVIFWAFCVIFYPSVFCVILCVRVIFWVVRVILYPVSLCVILCVVPCDIPMIPRYVPLLFDPRGWTAPNRLATSLTMS
jgi:hypothetical protein